MNQHDNEMFTEFKTEALINEEVEKSVLFGNK